MKRLLTTCALALPLFALAAPPAYADVKTRDKASVKFEGMLGRMFNLFGGKAAREGVESSSAVKGNRKATMNEATGQIIDLTEEKIYTLDMRKKTYTVMTFDELRRQMREAEERAKKNAEKEQPSEKPQQQKPEKEIEIDFDVKDTGQQKKVAGYDAHESIVTITVREKGKTLEEGGGLVMTNDVWLGPQVAQMKDVADFDRRYWQKLQGPEATAVSAEQMAAVVAMYPFVKSAMERMQKDSDKLKGTPLETTTTFESVKSKDQLAQEQSSSSNTSSGGGIGGMLARKMMKKDEAKARATVMTLHHEVLEVTTSVAASDVAIPADFKEKK